MKKLFAILILITANSVYANWEIYSQTESSITYYFKKDSYKTFFGGLEIVKLSDLNSPRLTGYKSKEGCYNDCTYYKEAYLSTRSSFELDCKKKQQRVLNIKFFSGNMGKGTVIDESKEKSGWFGLDSLSEQTFCKK